MISGDSYVQEEPKETDTASKRKAESNEQVRVKKPKVEKPGNLAFKVNLVSSLAICVISCNQIRGLLKRTSHFLLVL